MDSSTRVFQRLPEAKQATVLAAAAAEFARAGFTAARVDDIAAKAGISVGSLYQYFGTKENCFLAVLDAGIAELRSRLDEVLTRVAGPWERIEQIVRLIPEHSRHHGEIIRLYQEIGGEGLSELGQDFCRRFEGLSADVYSSLIREARLAGAIRSDVDEDFAAFFLDNLFVSLQFSFACDYHQLRKLVFLGTKNTDEEALVQAAMRFLRYGLAGSSGA